MTACGSETFDSFMINTYQNHRRTSTNQQQHKITLNARLRVMLNLSQPKEFKIHKITPNFSQQN